MLNYFFKVAILIFRSYLRVRPGAYGMEVNFENCRLALKFQTTFDKVFVDDCREWMAKYLEIEDDDPIQQSYLKFRRLA